MKRLTKHFALCLKNKGNDASLILGKVYRVVPDARAAKDDLVRIIDESGVLGQRSVGLRAGGRWSRSSRRRARYRFIASFAIASAVVPSAAASSVTRAKSSVLSRRSWGSWLPSVSSSTSVRHQSSSSLGSGFRGIPNSKAT